MHIIKSEPAAVTRRKTFLVIQAELMKYNAEYWIVWDTEKSFNAIDVEEMHSQLNETWIICAFFIYKIICENVGHPNLKISMSLKHANQLDS